MPLIKILNITEEARGGGPLNIIMTVAKKLNSETFKTLVLFPKNESSDFESKLIQNNVQHSKIRLHRLTKDPWHLVKYSLYFIIEVLRIKRFIKTEEIDLVHINNAYQIKGVIAAKMARVPMVWHLHDTKSPALVEVLFRWLAPFADGFIYASNRTKMYYENIYPDLRKKENTTIQSSIDTSVFYPNSSSVLSEYSGKKIISVGYLNENKGFHHLIHALSKIKEEYKDPVHLFIVGPAFKNQQAYLEVLKNKTKELNLSNVHFLGMRKDISNLLNAADIYVCASDFEASPISVWEAVACGLPIISTDVGDVKHLLQPLNLASIIDGEKTNAMAKLLISALKRENMHHEFTAAKTLCDTIFNEEKNVEAFEEIYKKVVNKSSVNI